MAGIGSLIVNIGADISGIRRDAAKGAESLGAVESATKTLSTVLKALAVGVAVRGLAQMVSGAMEAIDASAKLSRQLGGTINGLKGMQLAAGDAGVDATVLAKSMESLNRKLGEAARMGSGPAHDALERLGLDARELINMDLDQRMGAIADAIEGAGLSSQGTADALSQLGIRQGEFTRLMLDGGDAIRAARLEIDELGLSLSEVDAAKVEAANDAMERVKLASTATAQRLAVVLAPAITEISKRIVAMSKEVGGFDDAIETAVEIAVKGFGYVGDAIRGVRIVIKAVEVGGWNLAATLVDVFKVGTEAITTFVNAGIGEVNGLIAALNEIPGIDITPIALRADSPFMRALDEFSEAARATAADVFQQMKALATEEWPSDKAQEFFAAIQASAEAAAQNVISARREMTDFGAADEDAPGAKGDSELEKLRARLAAQLEALREYGMNSEELENTRHARRLSQLNAALDQELVSLAEFASISEGLERKHMEALVKIRKVGMDKSQGITFSSMAAGVKQITGMLSSLTSSAAKENRTMFNVNKAFAISDAIVSGAQGVAKTLGAFPMPYAAIFATAHAALAGAQVGLIAAQQFEGGGGRTVAAPGVSGGGASFSGAGGIGPQGQTTGGAGSGVTGGGSQLVSLNLQGDMYSRGSILALIDSLNEAISDGARIVVE